MQAKEAGNWTIGPVNTVAPVISGSVAVGQTLSSTTGTWTGNPTPTSFAYQWQSGTSDIVGATSSTYTVQAADVGSTLRCSVTATSTSGTASANSANTIVVPPEQQLWAWGINGYGRLGLNNTIDRSSPVQVGALTTWSQASTGDGSTVAVANDGTMWSWGRNNFGQLGRNSTTDFSSPVQIGALTNWYEAVISGTETTPAETFCAAIKTDGTLWTWGNNTFGRLGLNDTVRRSSPVQVGSLATWLVVSMARPGFCLAIKTDGTLWAWGENYSGQLGLNDTPLRSSPVQVGSDTDWQRISTGGQASFAIKTNGTLWSWGGNGQGRLGQNVGQGDVANRSSPVQIGALTTWSRVSAANGGFCAAVKTDGTLWAWGYGGSGQLGQNNIITRSSPVQIGALTTWSDVSLNASGCFAIKTDGTMWSWGFNGYGRLGLNDTANRSSPVQIGALTKWISLGKNSNSARNMMALRTP
jgi:alpha-tubulin suppressor-like RCC1 family protein